MPVFRQFLVDEFHLPAVFKFLDPLFVWYVHSSTGEVSGCRKYTLFRARNCGSGKEVGISESGQSSNRIGKVEVGGTRPRGGLRLSREQLAVSAVISLNSPWDTRLGGFLHTP